MEGHYNFSDAQFEKEFELGTLDPSYFSHEAHLRLAWIHISKYGREKAIDHITSQIKNYTKKLGAEDKYHATVTTAAVHIVHHFMLKTNHTIFKDFIASSSRLQNNFQELIKSHYSFNIFTSVEAKSNYIKPDLLPFDA